MKYLKKYEKLQKDGFKKGKYKKGDYIIFDYKPDDDSVWNLRLTPELRDFLNSTIGIIVLPADASGWIDVRYDYIPDNIKNKFQSVSNTILLDKNRVLCTAESKEDIEKKIAMNKYNL